MGIIYHSGGYAVGEIHWKPREDLELVECTCDCGNIYWTQVKEHEDLYTPIKACPHCNTCTPMVLRHEKKLL